MYFEKIDNPTEWVEAATKIDLFGTSDNKDILNIINKEEIIFCKESKKQDLHSPQINKIGHSFPKKFRYLCGKVKTS